MTRRMTLFKDVAVLMPTKNRADMLHPAIEQYDDVLDVFVLDGSDTPIGDAHELFTRPPTSSSLTYIHDPSKELHEARNKLIECTENAYSYLLHIDDDSFFKDPISGIGLMKELLNAVPEIWVTGGVGAYTAGFMKKQYGGPFYRSNACPGYAMMTRSDHPLKFRYPRRDDFIFGVDTWLAGGRVALHPDVIVDHLDSNIGGQEEKWEGKQRFNWYVKYRDILRTMFKDHPEVRIDKLGRGQVDMKMLGISDRRVNVD